MESEVDTDLGLTLIFALKIFYSLRMHSKDFHEIHFICEFISSKDFIFIYYENSMLIAANLDSPCMLISIKVKLLLCHPRNKSQISVYPFLFFYYEYIHFLNQKWDCGLRI